MKIACATLLLLSVPALARAQEQVVDEAAAMFAAMDSDRNGELSLREFEKGVSRPFGAREPGVVYQRLPARFRSLDGDQSGFLEAAEYAAFVQRWHGQGEAPALGVVDRNGDGRLDFREFAAMHVEPGEDASATGETSATEPTTEAAPASPGRMRSSRARPHAPISRTG